MMVNWKTLPFMVVKLFTKKYPTSLREDILQTTDVSFLLGIALTMIMKVKMKIMLFIMVVLLMIIIKKHSNTMTFKSVVLRNIPKTVYCSNINVMLLKHTQM